MRTAPQIPGAPPVAGPASRRAGSVAGALLLATWVVFLALSVLGALALGAVSGLSAPPLLQPGELGGWASAREPVVAAFAVVRIVFLAVACYLLVVTVLAVALRLGRAGRLVTVTDVLTLPFVRNLVHGALGVGLAGASLAAVGSAMSPGGARSLTGADVRLAVTATAAEGADGGQPSVAHGQDPPTMRRLGPSPAVPDPRASPPPADVPAAREAPAAAEAPAGTPAEAPAAAAEVRTPAAVPAPGQVIIEAGDHLWSVAARALEGAWGRAPDDAELAPYWEDVVEANRDRLADPANPDLLFPGQTVVVPPPGSPATLG